MPGRGLTVYFQVTPFQCRIRVLMLPALPVCPTAQALLAEVAVTPKSSALAAGLGLGIRFHVVPFQCRMRVLPLSVEPTAQAFWADVAATSLRMLPAGLGPGTRVQLEPFQRTIRAWKLVPLAA